MRRVYKYPIPMPTVHRFTIDLPAEAELLTVQVQNGAAHLWALVDPSTTRSPESQVDEQATRREFLLAGTGHNIDTANLRFIGIFQMLLFEVLP